MKGEESETIRRTRSAKNEMLMSYNNLKFFFLISSAYKEERGHCPIWFHFGHKIWGKKVQFLCRLKILIITIHVHSISRRTFSQLLSNWQTSAFFADENVETEMMSDVNGKSIISRSQRRLQGKRGETWAEI